MLEERADLRGYLEPGYEDHPVRAVTDRVQAHESNERQLEEVTQTL